MVTSILTVMEQVVELFLMIGVGVACSRVGMITRRGAAQLTSFLLYLVAPTLILVSLTGTDTDIGPEDLAMAFGLALLAHGLGILVSCLFFRKEPDARKRIFRFAAVYSNTGFMGIPLVQAVVGPEGVIYASIFVVVFNVVVWTHGYGLMSGGQRTGMKKLLLNPGLLALAVGLPMFFFGLAFPPGAPGASGELFRSQYAPGYGDHWLQYCPGISPGIFLRFENAGGLCPAAAGGAGNLFCGGSGAAAGTSAAALLCHPGQRAGCRQYSALCLPVWNRRPPGLQGCGRYHPVLYCNHACIRGGGPMGLWNALREPFSQRRHIIKKR